MEFIKGLQYTADVDEKRNAVKWCKWIVDPNGTGVPHNNVAEEISEKELGNIGQKVLKEYQIDKESRASWEEQQRAAMKLAKLVMEKKSDPWPGAASTKFPLITVSALQFAARAYPEIVKGSTPVKYLVIGEDKDKEADKRGKRVSAHMSYQLKYEMHDWEPDFDSLLHVLPVTGLVFKKTFFDPVDKVNVSQLCLPDDVVIHYNCANMRSVRRITHVVNYYQNDIFERIASKKWLDVEIPISSDGEKPDESDVVNTFLEQHRFLDLDGDGYSEPYIVTVHKESGKAVRILPRFEKKNIQTNASGELVRIIPSQYFVKYGFIPAPDGSIYDLGFGSLLFALNDAINSLINRLLDAGTLNNTQSGWINRALRDRGGIQMFKPGEWKKTDTRINGDMRTMLLPLPTKEPSNVLFLLLGLLIESGKEISSVKDVLTGKAPGANVPATTVLAMIEQGLKMFGAIYKRVYRSFGAELKQLYNLNSIYLEDEQYFRVLNDPEAKKVARQDYNTEDLDIMPTADPTVSTETQRLAKGQALKETVSGRPNVDEDEITRRLISSIDVPDEELLMVEPEDPPDPMEAPEIQIELAKIDIEREKVTLEAQKVELEEMKLEADTLLKAQQLEEMTARIVKLQAEATKLIAQAESEEEGIQLQEYLAEVQALADVTKEQIKAQGQQIAARRQGRADGTNQGGSKSVAARPGNTGGSAAA